MLGTDIPQGSLFYAKSGRRLKVKFTSEMRAQTIEAIKELHKLVESRRIPAPKYDKRCKKCSLKHDCLPKLANNQNSARGYLAEEFNKHI
jgi:CRISPR-associated exonuclease Cas4